MPAGRAVVCASTRAACRSPRQDLQLPQLAKLPRKLPRAPKDQPPGRRLGIINCFPLHPRTYCSSIEEARCYTSTLLHPHPGCGRVQVQDREKPCEWGSGYPTSYTTDDHLSLQHVQGEVEPYPLLVNLATAVTGNHVNGEMTTSPSTWLPVTIYPSHHVNGGDVECEPPRPHGDLSPCPSCAGARLQVIIRSGARSDKRLRTIFLNLLSLLGCTMWTLGWAAHT